MTGARAVLPLVALLATAAHSQDENRLKPMRWGSGKTLHFDIAHESPWMPKGLSFTAERIHRALEMELGRIESWSGKRLHLQVHRDKASYVAGEHQPPEWSNGFAVPSQGLLVLYEMEDKATFNRVTAHELTHLWLGVYFAEKKATPPLWVNEGLAMLMEDRAPDAAKDGWWQAARRTDRSRVRPIEEFAETRPSGNETEVADWYGQAYLMTRFLLLEKSRLKFRLFLERLRDGQDVQVALKQVYGFASAAKFDDAWMEYAGVRHGVASLAPKGGKSRELKPIEYLDVFKSTGTLGLKKSTPTVQPKP